MPVQPSRHLQFGSCASTTRGSLAGGQTTVCEWSVAALSALGQALDEQDEDVVTELLRELTDALRTVRPPKAADLDTALKLLQRHQRTSAILAICGVAALARLTTTSILHKYVLALLDDGQISSARAVMAQVPEEMRQTNTEIRGALGRIEKDTYLVLDSGTAAAQEALASGIEIYRGTYLLHPAQNWYHGINAVALLCRAQRDGVPLTGYPDPAGSACEIAQQILELANSGTVDDDWLLATAAEAALAVDDAAEALNWTWRYLAAKAADRFAIASTLRQLTGLWQLTADREPGALLLPMIQQALLHAGGQVQLPLAVAPDTSDGRWVSERILVAGGMVPITWPIAGNEAGHAVCLVTVDMRVGTGFVLAGNFAGERGWPSVVVLTNQHVLGAAPEVDISLFFDTGGGTGLPLTVRGVRRLWTDRFDPSETEPPLDVCVLGVPAADQALLPALQITETPDLNRPKQHRAYLIGHPEGGEKKISLHETRLVSVDGVWAEYTSPTEEGNSGSPVFDDRWRVFAIHCQGGRNAQQSNRGILLEAIIKQIRRTPAEHLAESGSDRTGISTLSQTEACQLAASGAEYRSIVTVQARQLDAPQEWTSRSGSLLRGQAGDWVLLDDSDEWTITDSAFVATYRQRADGSWEKPSTVRAIRIDGPVDVETPEGISHGGQGDWLVTGRGAGAWPITARAFARRYVPIED